MVFKNARREGVNRRVKYVMYVMNRVFDGELLQERYSVYCS